MLKDNPDKINEYVKETFDEYNKDGDRSSLLASLKLVAKLMNKSVAQIAKEKSLNRRNLYSIYNWKNFS